MTGASDLTLLFSLLLGHLCGDFLLQRAQVVRDKARLHLPALLEHGALQWVATLAVVTIFGTLPLLSWRTQGALLALAVLHILIDATKATAVGRSWLRDGPLAFILDQLLHLVIILAVALSLQSGPSGLLQLAAAAEANRDVLLIVGVVYVAVVFGAAHLIRYLLQPLASRLAAEADTEGLEDAGRYIGWLERFLVLTAVLIESATAVGLIVAAKSIFRFPELKGRPFAEYFLIGTLLSITVAVIGGLVLLVLVRAPTLP